MVSGVNKFVTASILIGSAPGPRPSYQTKFVSKHTRQLPSSLSNNYNKKDILEDDELRRDLYNQGT